MNDKTIALLRGDNAPRCFCGRSWSSNNDGWLNLGVAPIPQSSWQSFWHRVAHGSLMRFPMYRVLLWSWQHRHSFQDNEGR